MLPVMVRRDSKWTWKAVGETGFAVPTVLFMILGTFAVAMVAAVVSVSAQRGTVRDADTKTALAVAEAGVSEALLRYNRVPTTGVNTCVVSTAGTILVAPPVAGWCSPVSGTTTQGTFKYSVAPSAGQIEIVSVGVSNGVTRRVQVTADSVSGQKVFSDFQVKGRDFISPDSNAEIRADTATNGDMNLLGSAKLCGTGSVGVGRNLTLDSNALHAADTDCTGTGALLHEPLALPSVNQGDAATVNDNGRFFDLDARTGGDKVAWNAATRTLTLSQNSSLTLGGSIYSLCKLEMSSNTAIYVAPGSSVSMYFDSPEACELPSGSVQLNLDSNSRITTTGGGAADFAIFMVGSDVLQTKMQLNSNTQVAGACEQNFVIYAPRTDATFISNSTYCGAIAAKSILLSSNARLYTSSSAKDFVLPGAAPHYEAGAFVECASIEQTPPDAGC